MKMDIQILDQKTELIQWLITLEDEAIIEKLIQIRYSEKKDMWDGLTKEEKESIEKGIIDAENNKLNNHSMAQRLYEEWL